MASNSRKGGGGATQIRQAPGAPAAGRGGGGGGGGAGNPAAGRGGGGGGQPASRKAKPAAQPGLTPQQLRALEEEKNEQLVLEIIMNLGQVLDPYGYGEEEIRMLAKQCNHDRKNIEAAVANIIEDKSGHEHDAWANTLTASERKTKAAEAKARREQKDKEIAEELERSREQKRKAEDERQRRLKMELEAQKKRTAEEEEKKRTNADGRNRDLAWAMQSGKSAWKAADADEADGVGDAYECGGGHEEEEEDEGESPAQQWPADAANGEDSRNEREDARWQQRPATDERHEARITSHVDAALPKTGMPSAPPSLPAVPVMSAPQSTATAAWGSWGEAAPQPEKPVQQAPESRWRPVVTNPQPTPVPSKPLWSSACADEEDSLEGPAVEMPASYAALLAKFQDTTVLFGSLHSVRPVK